VPAIDAKGSSPPAGPADDAGSISPLLQSVSQGYSLSVSEFFEPPPPPPAEPTRHHRPPWSGPPHGTLPGVAPIELLLAHSQKAATYITHLTAYPTGFEFELRAISAAEEHQADLDLFGRHWPRVGDKRDELPPQLLRIGVQFADGRKATNIAGHDRPPSGPVMWALGGGGAGGSFHQAYWVWPLPPPGPLAFVCEWPVAGIPLTRREIDAQPILEAADRAQAIFADEERDRGGSWSSTTLAAYQRRYEQQAEQNRPA
jgi:hypothetical protein